LQVKVILREIALTLVLAIFIFLILQFTVQSFIIVGSSMQPNFQDGERLLINKVVYKFRPPERGEVIVFHPPANLQTDYIKRVIALPGETVEVKDGGVYVNGIKLDEPYIKNPAAYTLSERKVPENKYFVLGDNRNNSDDSHNGWTLPRENIIGKAWFSFWPPGELGLIRNYLSAEQLAISGASGG
jgi:signal peptidase I